MSDTQVQGKKFNPSNRHSSDVKVGDWVKIHDSLSGSKYWPAKDQKTLGTYQQVEEVFDNGVHFVDNSGFWRKDYFTIMEEIPEQTKIPRNHPHAEMIRQWLDDASLEVEYKTKFGGGIWYEDESPCWADSYEYRFKPKTVPAWQVLYELDGTFDITQGHYKSQEEFDSVMGCGEKFIKFVLETEKQIQA